LANGRTAIDGNHPIGSDRPRDVLELLLADVREGQIELARGILLHPRRDANPARLCQSFEPCGDIDAIAKNVAVLDDDVPHVDTDAKLDAAVGRNTRVARGHLALHLDRAAQRVDDAGELDKQSVAGGLDEATPMLGDFRIKKLTAHGLEAFEGAALVGTNEPRIARHIGREDRREAAGLAHVASPPARRRPDSKSSRSSGRR